MILTEQCCLKWQSDKLAELGVTAESEFYHLTAYGNQIGQRCDKGFVIVEDGSVYTEDMPSEFIASAYTVAELARPVAGWMNDNNWGTFDSILKKYTNGQTGNAFSVIYNPQYLADCLIHLLENNLLTAEQVNEAINR